MTTSDEATLERDRDRWCEALAGGRWQKATRFDRLVLLRADSAAFWTRIKREDRVADLAGQPPTCELTWSWPNSDGSDSETCGSRAVVAVDLATEQARCADHLAEVLEQDDPYAQRRLRKMTVVLP